MSPVSCLSYSPALYFCFNQMISRTQCVISLLDSLCYLQWSKMQHTAGTRSAISFTQSSVNFVFIFKIPMTGETKNHRKKYYLWNKLWTTPFSITISLENAFFSNDPLRGTYTYCDDFRLCYCCFKEKQKIVVFHPKKSMDNIFLNNIVQLFSKSVEYTTYWGKKNYTD